MKHVMKGYPSFNKKIDQEIIERMGRIEKT
jgi:hypothetical protein